MSEEIVKVYACNREFTIRQNALEKAEFFKCKLHFEQNNWFENNILKIKTDLEPDTFSHVIEHMKYNSCTHLNNIKYEERQRIKQMAEYIQYSPLMNKEILKPKEMVMEIVDSDIYIDTDVDTDGQNYVISCMENKYPGTFFFDKISKKIPNTFVKKTYEIDMLICKYFSSRKEAERILNITSTVVDFLKKIQKDIKMSMHNILIHMENYRILYIKVKWIGDDMLSIPCLFVFDSMPYRKYTECKRNATITIINFSNKLPQVYCSK
jgi:hypothetical protein